MYNNLLLLLAVLNLRPIYSISSHSVNSLMISIIVCELFNYCMPISTREPSMTINKFSRRYTPSTSPCLVLLHKIQQAEKHITLESMYYQTMRCLQVVNIRPNICMPELCRIHRNESLSFSSYFPPKTQTIPPPIAISVCSKLDIGYMNFKRSSSLSRSSNVEIVGTLVILN